MAEVLVSSTDTPEQVAAALSGAAPTTETPVSATTEVDHSIGAPFTVPDDSKKAEADPAQAQAAEPAPSDKPAADAAAKPKKHNDPQKRIDELTWQRRETERKNAELLAQLQAREQELAALRNPQPPPSASQTPAGAVDPNEPTEDQFETYTAFIEARAEYRAEKKASEIAEKRLDAHFAAERDRLARAEAARTEQALAAAHAQRTNDAKSRYADFDEVVGSSDVEVSLVMRDAIVQSPLGPDLTYYLGSHPDECARIAALPPARALIEMGRLEALVDRQASAPTVAPSAPVVTHAPMPVPALTTAPPPITPITGGAPAATADDNLPMREWIRRQNALDRSAGRL